MQIELKEDFEIIEEGTIYNLPMYQVEEGKGIVLAETKQTIHFVRGSKLKDENVEPHTGTLHEHLLSMMIHDLNYKQKLVPSRETAVTITKLEEAMHWLRQRQINRIKAGVVGTYKN